MLHPCVWATLVPTCVRICVPPPQEEEQEPQAPHSLEVEEQLGWLHSCRCLLTHVPRLPFLSQRVALLLSLVPEPQVTEHSDHSLHGLAGSGVVAGKPTGGLGVVRMSTGHVDEQ